MNLLLILMAALAAGDDDLLISDFEGRDYGAWTATGTAFGPGPASGTLPGQMAVTGFLGKGLVNSFLGGDASVGTLTSPPFVIQRKAINFLIGGGRHPGETCVNLRIDGAVVRSATGRDSEHLDWDGWDVAELAGRTATLEIVDRHAGGWGHICVDHIVQSDRSLRPQPHARDFAAESRYLFLPVRTGLPKRQATLAAGGGGRLEFEIELADRDPQFWAFVDLREWKGKTVRLEVVGPPAVQDALDAVTQGDELRGAAPLYSEAQRPQVHFTSRRGWLNDPNGLVYSAGEYHLFYQHNPFGWAWGNMHWGHAVSRDLVHWEELPIALYPVRAGDWAFSGSAVVDAANTSGFKSGAEDVLVAAYTSTGRGECIVYSNDRGRTWAEYSGNPVVKHQGRDPRLLWHAPTKRWVMAVYHESGGTQSIAFHTSPDLKTWTYRSRIDGFYECPDLFELAADGDAPTRRWVLLAADGRYLLGAFDGERFAPEGEKRTLWHGAFYAAQTFSNEPSGRRVQIGWARGTDFPGMPFNQQMNVPVELRLRSTPEGLRLAATPVKEIDSLRARKTSWDARPFRPGERLLDGTSADAADLELSLRPGTAERVVLGVHGLSLVCDARRDLLTAGGVSAPLHGAGGALYLRVLVDRGSVEVFTGDGLSALCVPHRTGEDRSFALTAVGGAGELESAALFELRSAWK